MSLEKPAEFTLPPAAQILNMVIVGRIISHSIGVAARLDLATRIGGGTMTAEELARATGSNPDALYRVMRALASVGVFVETEPGSFGNTPLSDSLRADAPMSTRPLALLFGHEVHVQAWLGLDHSVATGDSGFVHVHGEPAFMYAAKHPDVGAVFNDAMTAFSAADGPAIAGSYPFDGIDQLVDIGGGHGQLLATILGRNPALSGVLFDQPHVVAGAGPVIEAAGMAGRIEVVGGDFFQNVPEGDAYIAKSVLHDWSDDDAARILQAIRAAARPGARLILAEAVLEPGNQPDVAKFMDLEMLVVAGGGRERNAEQWTSLLAAGGFQLDRVIPTPSPFKLIEASLR